MNKNKKFNKQYYSHLLKKGKNKIHVYPGAGYMLQTITTNKETLSIEELYYIMMKAGKGDFYIIDDLNSSELEYYSMYNDCYAYVDGSMFGLKEAYINIEHLYTEGVELFG